MLNTNITNHLQTQLLNTNTLLKQSSSQTQMHNPNITQAITFSHRSLIQKHCSSLAHCNNTACEDKADWVDVTTMMGLNVHNTYHIYPIHISHTQLHIHTSHIAPPHTSQMHISQHSSRATHLTYCICLSQFIMNRNVARDVDKLVPALTVGLKQEHLQILW